MRYRTRSAEVRAWQFDGTLDGARAVEKVAGGGDDGAYPYMVKTRTSSGISDVFGGTMHVWTPNGLVVAHKGDWVVEAGLCGKRRLMVLDPTDFGRLFEAIA